MKFAASSPMPSDALDSITIQGFKSIASIENLKLRPINILIGANGSGKSNFIGVFAFLHAIREGRLQAYVAEAGGAEKVLHFGSKTTREISIRLSFRSEAIPHGVLYKLTLAPNAEDSLLPLEESACYPTRPVRYSEYNLSREGQLEAGISQPNPSSAASWVSARLGGWRPYHGSTLPAFLYYLRKIRGESYHLIRQTIQRVAPFFEDFRFDPLRLRPDDMKLEWKQKNSDQYFDSSSLSDGTVRFIALATLLLQPESERPSIILIDQPELGLHPLAIGILASLIRQASVETQVIVSTQSPLLLDHFQPEDVLVADRVDGATQITRPDAGRLAKWLEELGGCPVRD